MTALGRKQLSAAFRQHERQVSRRQSFVEQGTPQKAICENHATTWFWRTCLSPTSGACPSHPWWILPTQLKKPA